MLKYPLDPPHPRTQTGTLWHLFLGKIMQMPVCTWTFLLKIGATNHSGKGLDPPPPKKKKKKKGNAHMNRYFLMLGLPLCSCDFLTYVRLCRIPFPSKFDKTVDRFLYPSLKRSIFLFKCLTPALFLRGSFGGFESHLCHCFWPRSPFSLF